MDFKDHLKSSVDIVRTVGEYVRLRKIGARYSGLCPFHTEKTPSFSVNPGLGIDLEQAIAALPAGARAVFVLHDVEGYTHDEIAGLSGIAEGTSKAQLFRARRLLREALDR